MLHATMFQIVFNAISAAEMAALPKLIQLELLGHLQEVPPEAEEGEGNGHFRVIERHGRRLLRLRTAEHRLYFERKEEGILVHRVLSKNTLEDFLFRSKLPMVDEEAPEHATAIWQLVEEGERSGRR